MAISKSSVSNLIASLQGQVTDIKARLWTLETGVINLNESTLTKLTNINLAIERLQDRACKCGGKCAPTPTARLSGDELLSITDLTTRIKDLEARQDASEQRCRECTARDCAEATRREVETAFKQGLKIELRLRSRDGEHECTWVKCSDPLWKWDTFEYRVAEDEIEKDEPIAFRSTWIPRRWLEAGLASKPDFGDRSGDYVEVREIDSF